MSSRPVWLIAGFFLGLAAESLAADPPAAPPARRGAQADGRRRLALLSRTHGGQHSAERGLTPHWPEDGPKIVWQVSLGTGYSSPVTSEGRLFQFDRQGNRARLRALESETGKPLWQFDYPSDYEDTYGYDNGPRIAGGR